MSARARRLPVPRPVAPHIPQALTLGIVLMVLGFALDQLWRQQLVYMTVRSGVGPLLGIVGCALALTVLVPALFRKDAYRWRQTAKRLEKEARVWEQRARAQEEAHTRFIRELDHELKNPLQAMKSAFADLNGGAEKSDSIRTASAQVDRLRQLTSSLRQVANVTPEKLAREKVELDELVGEAVDLARSAKPDSGSRIHLLTSRIAWRSAPVMVDRELIAQAIYNLIDNALKYSPKDSHVEVRLHEDGRRASVEVADSGRGIDQKDLPRVTESCSAAIEPMALKAAALDWRLWTGWQERMVAR
jgi:two-component system, OmpR family, sensor kinase